nr:hypothetical protein [Escherichia coli]
MDFWSKSPRAFEEFTMVSVWNIEGFGKNNAHPEDFLSKIQIMTRFPMTCCWRKGATEHKRLNSVVFTLFIKKHCAGTHRTEDGITAVDRTQFRERCL